MGDKKKAAAPPAKAPTPPAKSASPPSTPAPTTTPAGKDDSPTQAPAVEGNFADMPVKAGESGPVTGPTVAPGLPKLDLPALMPDLKTQPSALTGPFDLPPVPPIDWLEMRRPFINRGLTFGEREQAEIQSQWGRTYRMMIGLGLGPGLSLKIADTATPIAIDNALKIDNPTRFDMFEKDTEKMLGRPVGTFTMSIITPGTLGTAIKAVTGKTVDLSF